MANHIKYSILPKKPFLLLKEPKGDPVIKAVYTILKNKFTLKHVDRVDFSFDPFHHNVSSIRELIFYLSTSRIRGSNDKCSVKTTLKANREEPEIKLKLENGKEIVYRTSNLTTLEILEHWTNYISKLAPVEEKVTTSTRRGPIPPNFYGYHYKKQKPDWEKNYSTPIPKGHYR